MSPELRPRPANLAVGTAVDMLLNANRYSNHLHFSTSGRNASPEPLAERQKT